MHNFSNLGYIKSNFTEKFGIPRQPGLSPSSKAQIVLEKTAFNQEATLDLGGNSHIWIIFVFHNLKKVPDKAKIRPPRLGGNKYVGVFSSRSPYRPNPIGLSLVKLHDITSDNHCIYLNISDHDLLDGTPVIDIKPYSEYDMPINPSYNWQAEPWTNLEVTFSEESLLLLEENRDLKNQIIEVLSNDPRPAYTKNQKRKEPFGLTLGNYNIKFTIDEQFCCVLSITKLNKLA